jgi:hypothetical protein
MTTKKPARKSTSKKTTTKRTATKGRAPLLGSHPVPAAKLAPAPAKKEARRTMFGAAKALIAAGKTNAEVLEALKREFKLPAAHDYYPRWYRARMVMDGLITKAFASEHAGPRIARKPA